MKGRISFHCFEDESLDDMYRKLSMFFLTVLLFTEISFANNFIVAGDENYPPFEYIDYKGNFKGFNVDISKELFKLIDYDMDLKPMVWKEAMQALTKGEIDGIQGMKVVESRKNELIFTDPYIIISDGIFVPMNNQDIVELQDFRNKKVAVQKNDNVVKNFLDVPNVNIIYTKDQEEAVKLLHNGQVDACVVNKLTGFYIIQKNDYKKTIKHIGNDINPIEYGLAFKKDKKELVKELNAALKKIKNNGTYNKIYGKWFGEISVPIYERYAKYIYSVFIMLLSAVLVIIVFYNWNSTLKKEVKKRTMKLEEESIFKEQILNSMFDAIFNVDRNGYIIWTNENANKLIEKKSKLNLDLKKHHYENTILGDIVTTGEFKKVANEKEGIYYLEKSIKIDGVEHIYQYNITPLRFKDKDINIITIAIRDITNRRKMMEKLTFKDKLESLGRLVAGIGHEIKNPLMIINSYIKLLEHNYNDEKFKDSFFEIIPSEVETLNKLLLDILEFSKPTKTIKEEVNLKDFILDMYIFFKSQFKTKNIEFDMELEEGLYWKASRQQLKQAFMNFIFNSIDSMEDSSQKKLTIKLCKKLDNIIIKIIDTGCGIDEKDLSKVIEPFYSTKEKGTGLGMSISYSMIKENSGILSIESKKGEGTTLTVIFKSVDK
ncbi:MAG: transporter substrate-binding domain-containing protein [Peptostreptococcaceae bacterium]|jgi:polar amino acid transport system substrate-binding protein|nr:transporter substrate-binding domain-containing protein [Peptostreptococcaceae bacterium]